MISHAFDMAMSNIGWSILKILKIKSCVPMNISKSPQISGQTFWNFQDHLLHKKKKEKQKKKNFFS